MRCLASGIVAVAITAAAVPIARADDQAAPASDPGPVVPAAADPVPPAPSAGASDEPLPTPSATPKDGPVAAPDSSAVPPPTQPPAQPAAPVGRQEEPAADGTTSVIVPAAPVAGASSAATPPGATQQEFQPVPADLPQPPPHSEAALTLAEMLEPLAATPGRVLAPPEALLYVRPLHLLEALARSGDRSRRLWIVQAYWKVSAAYAAVRNATEALERLELVAPGADPHDRATLDVTTAAARADLAETRARLGAAQQELIDLARLPVGEPLPWPVDRPLADPYQTHFEVIFANRLATGRVRAIVRGLPARHEAVAARAAAVIAAEKAMAMAEADHAKGNRPIEAVVAAHLAVTGQQERFLQAVETYNIEIAEYAMAVAELALPDDQFVSMLIGTSIQWRPTAPVAPVAAGLSEAYPPPVSPAVGAPPTLVPATGTAP